MPSDIQVGDALDVVDTVEVRVMRAVPDLVTDPRRTVRTDFESRTATTNHENRAF